MRKTKILALVVIVYVILLAFNGCSNNEKNIKDYNKLSENTENEEENDDYNPMLMLVNDKYWLDESFVPINLEKINIPFSGAASDEEMHMEYEAGKALEKLVNAALIDGIELYGVSGYRSYDLQQHIYEVNVANNGQEYTDDYVAIPGRSEHQTGLAMDLGDETGNLIGQGKESEWIHNNAYLYGFILRYPEGKENITGYNYEAWHIRYVGINVAKKIYSDDITFEEYYEY